MTSDVLDQATRLYVFVDDFLKAHPELAHWRRSNNDDPAFTDAEVLAVGLMQGSLGVATLRKTHAMIRDNIGFAFPRLPGYKQWVRRLHALAFIAGRLVEAAFALVALSSVRLYLLDAKPVPVCKPIRHGRVRLLREDGAYFGKTSAGWFFGFKLHVITHLSGAVMAAALTPGNWDDRPVAPALCAQTAGGIALGDTGYSGAAFFERMLDESGVAVVTPRDAAWGSDEQRTLSGARERVETTLRQLWDRFCDRVYARSWEGLWSVTLLKLVHLNLCYAGIASI
jgi:transposase